VSQNTITDGEIIFIIIYAKVCLVQINDKICLIQAEMSSVSGLHNNTNIRHTYLYSMLREPTVFLLTTNIQYIHYGI